MSLILQGDVGANIFNKESQTLYVGNLDESVTESLLMQIFGSIAPVKHCKIIKEGQDHFSFLTFESNDSACHALNTMNNRLLEGKPMKVNWAAGHNPLKVDTSRHYHVFVGDLCPELDTQILWSAFKKFGEVSDCKIIRDSATLKSKGYGFVSFLIKEDAEYAIREMNGVTLGSKVIRTNWACRKTLNSNNLKETSSSQHTGPALSYNEVYKLASDSNTTVYCGSIPPDMTVDDLRTIFSEHGNVQDVRVFGEKGYAFVKFAAKESATNAIVKVNGTQYGDRVLKCFWGKEAPVTTNETYNNAYNSYASQDSMPKVAAAISPMQYAAAQYYPTMAYANTQPQQFAMMPNQAAAPATYLPQQTYPQMYYQNWVNLPIQQGVQLPMQYTAATQQPLVYEMAPPTAFQTQ